MGRAISGCVRSALRPRLGNGANACLMAPSMETGIPDRHHAIAPVHGGRADGFARSFASLKVVAGSGGWLPYFSASNIARACPSVAIVSAGGVIGLRLRFAHASQIASTTIRRVSHFWSAGITYQGA